MLTELERLRYENRALKDRMKDADIAAGGFVEASEKSIAVLKELGAKLDDPNAIDALEECVFAWSNLLDEIKERARTFAGLPATPTPN